MKHTYKPRGTCSTKIDFEIGDDGTIRNLRFTDGCNGNLNGISTLVEGLDAREIAAKLKGTRCGRKKTSCPDQLALAIEQALEPASNPEAR